MDVQVKKHIGGWVDGEGREMDGTQLYRMDG